MNGQPDGQPTNLDRTVPEINNTDNNSARSDEEDSIAHFQDAQDPYEDDDSGMSFDSIALHNLNTEDNIQFVLLASIVRWGCPLYVL